MYSIILHFYIDVHLRHPKSLVNFSLSYIEFCGYSEDANTVWLPVTTAESGEACRISPNLQPASYAVSSMDGLRRQETPGQRQSRNLILLTGILKFALCDLLLIK